MFRAWRELCLAGLGVSWGLCLAGVLLAGSVPGHGSPLAGSCKLDLPTLMDARIARLQRNAGAYSHGFEIAEALVGRQGRLALVKLNASARSQSLGQCLWQPRLEVSSATLCGSGRRFFSFGPAEDPVRVATAMPESYCASCHRSYGDPDAVFWKKLRLELDPVPATTIRAWVGDRVCVNTDRKHIREGRHEDRL